MNSEFRFVSPQDKNGYSPLLLAMRLVASALSTAFSKSLKSGSFAASSALMNPLRLAALSALATSGLRAAHHSTSWSLIRSHGGLPITASNPPVSPALSQFDHTPGKATCQFR